MVAVSLKKFFFFKQKTAYEIGGSDWSSDVCSSDLGELKRVNGMLNNEKFMSKAPEAKINEEKAKLEKYQAMMSKVEEELAAL